MSTLMLLAIVIPVLATPLIALVGRYPDVRETVTLVTGGILLCPVISLLEFVLAGGRPAVELFELLPGLVIGFEAEPLGMIFATIAAVLWPLNSLYSIGYMRGHQEKHQTRFYICFAIAIASVMGIAFASNLLTLFIFYEMLTLSTYPLVTHSGTEQARKSGRTYLGILIGTSIGLLLPAIIWTWSVAGTLEFTPGGVFDGNLQGAAVGLMLLLYMFGIGKAALMPVHRWLPAAMVAPTPVSALLHAVAVVKAGVFSVVKIVVYVFGLDLLSGSTATQWLLYIAAFTILAASIVALRQDNLKRRLAYSTVSQLSYVVMGALLANAVGIVGSAMHIAMHAFGKITLFFCAGAIMVATHKTEISQMRGLGRVMPITMGAFLIGSLSIIGIPPAGGTWSKWYLALGTLESGQLVLLAVLMLSTLLNVFYLLAVPMQAFFHAPASSDAGDGIREAPLTCVMALSITALGCLALFVYPEPLYRLASAIIN